MSKLLKLGSHYASDFIKMDESYTDRPKFSLDLILDKRIGAVRLEELTPTDVMFGKYWYKSGINEGMIRQLKDIVEEITSRISYKKDDIWLDIATNDATLLKMVPDSFIKVGIDPADDTFLAESSKVATIVQDFFSVDAYNRSGFGHKKPKVITTIAMFYDLSDPDSFIKDIVEILDDDGIWVVQMSYTPLMIKQLDFSNVCGEHVYYYSLNSIKKLVEPHGLKIIDCSINNTNGGSFRITFQKNTANPNTYGNQPVRDCCNLRVDSLLTWENTKCDISNPEIWNQFQKDIDSLKETTVNFIKTAKLEGKTIGAIGASTKGNTLLQYFGLNNSLIDFISERSPAKFGLKTIGTDIPIISEEEARVRKPDYMLVLPWHFISEISARESEYLNNGGKLIVPCPKFTIISK